ncbi:hypothetical protein ACFL10_00370 [Patescibacteria group bacterium]
MCNIKDPFLRLFVYGLLGALVGMVAGFVFGLAIWGLQLLVCEIGLSRSCHGDIVNIATFLGSGAGAFVGAVMGSVLALKKK